MKTGRKSIVVFFLFCTCAVYNSRTVMAADTNVFTGTKTEFEKFGYAVAGSEWEFNLGETKKIFVCWENPNDENARARELAQEQVQQTWQHVSALIFSGWSKCTPGNDGIRILYEDAGPHVKAFGKDINKIENGMVLNHLFVNWKPACPFDNETCIRTIAVHEFGHALGFAHEQNRPDTPGECAAKHGQDQADENPITPYDKDSIMNYCNDENNNGELSEYDILAVQRLYGKP